MLSITELKRKLSKELNLWITIEDNNLLISNCKPKLCNTLLTKIKDNGYEISGWFAYRDLNGNIIDKLTLKEY